MSQFVLAAAFTAFSMSFHYILASILSRGIALGYAEYLISSILPASAYTGLIAIPCFSKLTSFYGLSHLEELL